MEKTFSEETEGAQMGEALAAVSGASPYQPKDLSDSIKDIVILVCNYCEKPTIRKQTKMKVVNGLIGMLKETNGFLSYYIEDLKQARCIEPFCLSSKQDDDHHLFWTFIEKLCEEIRDEEAYPILKCLIAQFNSLLAEAEIAKLNCDPIVFKEFFLRKKEEFNYENVMIQFYRKLHRIQPVTLGKLKKLQLEVVLKALNQGIFDYAEKPSRQEVNKVAPELETDILPCDYEITDKVRLRYAQFRQLAEKRGHMLVFDYERYGQYVVDNFNQLKDLIRAIFELDVKLRLIHMEMMKGRSETVPHADDMQEQPIEDLKSDVERFIGRVKAIFAKAAEKNGESITLNAKGWSGQYTFYVDANRISRMLDDLRQNSEQKVKDYLALFKGCTSVSAVAPFVGEILDIEELRVKELQKSDMKFAFEPFYGMSATAVGKLSLKVGNTESEMLINTLKGLLRKYPKG